VTGEAPSRLVLVGWGAIGSTVGAMLAESATEIVGVAVRDPDAPRDGLPGGTTVICEATELAALAPTVVAEAAGRESVGPWGRAALRAGADFVVSSVSAFADTELLAELTDLAQASGAQLHVQPGALGGVDALAAARLMGIDRVEHRIIKPPHAWSGTPAETMCDLAAIDEVVEFYSASAAATASAFPKNANVAMTTALAGIGPDRTMVTLVADPTSTTNRHEISAHGEFGSLDVAMANKPLPANPKTSAMAALNLVRSIENRTATIVL